MKRFKVGQQISFSMLHGGTVQATVKAVTETSVTLTECWTAEDTGESVSADTTYPKHTDADGTDSIVIWEYHGERGVVYGEGDLSDVLADSGIDQIEDDEEFCRTEHDFVRDYCKKQQFQLTEEDLAVIKNRGLADALEDWKND